MLCNMRMCRRRAAQAASSLRRNLTRSSRLQQESGQAQFVRAYDGYAVTTYSKPELVLVKGQGSIVTDLNNNEYIDFMSGIAVTALGHSDPGVSEILCDQARKLIHSSNLYHNDWAPRLAKKLVDETIKCGGMSQVSRVFLSNSGTEANEAALKFARKHGKTKSKGRKLEVVSFKGSFHGRTMGALSMTVNPKYQTPFSPLIPHMKYGELNDIDALDSLVTEETCGVIVEPVQGEGGVNSCTVEFLTALRKRCSLVNALLIYDEIQCGLGRTGQLWAHSIAPDAHPDILTTAKGLGNGFPIGATLITEEVEQALEIGDHGTTFGGSVIGSRVAHHVVSTLSDPDFLAAVNLKSEIFQQRFAQWQTKYPETVKEYRGRGLILGLELHTNPQPALDYCREHGLLLITCGVNTIRLVPALNIPNNLITRGLDILEDALAQLQA